MEESENALREQASRGDRRALRRLYQQFAGRYADVSDQDLRTRCARHHDVLAYAVLLERLGSARMFYQSFALSELVFLYWHGDGAASDVIYPRFQERFYSRVVRLLASGGGARQQADDIFQAFCIDVLITHKNQLAVALRDKSDDYFGGYLLRRLTWAVQDHLTAGRSPLRATVDFDEDDLTGYNDNHNDPADLSVTEQSVATVFALIAAEPCDRRSLYLAYHYGVRLADLAVLTGSNENTVKNRVITAAGRKIRSGFNAIADGDQRAPETTPSHPDVLRRCAARAESTRETLQALFRDADALFTALGPDEKRNLNAWLSEESVEKTPANTLLAALTNTGSSPALDAGRLADTLAFISSLRTLSCEPREALLCWDYLRQPLSDVARSTVRPADLVADTDPAEIVYRRWRSGAAAVLDRLHDEARQRPLR